MVLTIFFNPLMSDLAFVRTRQISDIRLTVTYTVYKANYKYGKM